MVAPDNGAIQPAETDASVAVILVSWNTRDLLDRAIASALAAGTERRLHVYVVDNASSDGSPEMVAARYPSVTLIRNPTNAGFGRANNQAALAAGEPYLLLLNSDAELRPGALGTMVGELETHRRAGAVGARLVFPSGSFQAAGNDFPSLGRDVLALMGLARWVYGPRYPSHTEAASRVAREVDWVGGACMLLRRAAFMAVGGFDPDYHMYAEEMDICRRIWDAGWSVRTCPEAVALHHGGQSTRRRPVEQPRLLWESRLRYYRRHKPPGQAALLQALVRGGYAARAAAWGLRGLTAGPAEAARWRGRARSAWEVVRGL